MSGVLALFLYMVLIGVVAGLLIYLLKYIPMIPAELSGLIRALIIVGAIIMIIVLFIQVVPLPSLGRL